MRLDALWSLIWSNPPAVDDNCQPRDETNANAAADKNANAAATADKNADAETKKRRTSARLSPEKRAASTRFAEKSELGRRSAGGNIPGEKISAPKISPNCDAPEIHIQIQNRPSAFARAKALVCYVPKLFVNGADFALQNLRRVSSLVDLDRVFTSEVTSWNFGILAVISGSFAPGVMTYPLFAICRLVLGTLYPAYASYKAVRTKNVREYVKWMMYWIVFAFFTTFETFSDIFIAFWFPFYYEVKLLFLLWLISPVSRGSLGSSMLYRKLVHPNLMKREEEIDRMISRLQTQGYNTALRFGSRAWTYLTNLVVQTAVRGGGGLVHQLKKSYSLTDLSNVGQVDFDAGNTKAIGFEEQVDPRNRSSSYSDRLYRNPQNLQNPTDSEDRGEDSATESDMRARRRNPRRHTEQYTSPSTEPYPATTRRKPPVKESLLDASKMRRGRPKSLALGSAEYDEFVLANATSSSSSPFGQSSSSARQKTGQKNWPKSHIGLSTRQVNGHPEQFENVAAKIVSAGDGFAEKDR